ncbi:MAG: hypothetical protein HEQ27_21770 [Dolichospermum sp. JUN01]|jgi:hypothetical protein|nr:hypothetical protein [Dolichospermum sp. JUN01]QSV53095.1 MAG: hypothetical protein HEP80_03360 [Dolichospermum sp. UKL201]
MGRYSDIRRGVELNKALIKLRAYEDLERPQKQAAYKAQRGSSVRVKPKRIKGYIESFRLTGRVYLPARLLGPTQSSNSDIISLVRTSIEANGRSLASDFTLPSGGTQLDGLSGFKPARFGVIERGARVSDNKSRVTNFEYSRYDNKSVSSAFGSAGTGSEPYDTAVDAIRKLAAVKEFLAATEGNRIYFTPEIL